MHQSTSPSLLQTIWPRWASRQFLTLLIVQTLLPVTFGYSLSSEAVIMRQLRRWKRLWGRSLWGCEKRLWKRLWGHAPTRGLPWGLPEVVGTVQQVHCNRRRLLRRGLEFLVSTIHKSAHTKKSGNLFNDPRIYIWEPFKKFLASTRKKRHRCIYLLWHYTTTSYKTRKTNSYFSHNFCAVETYTNV